MSGKPGLKMSELADASGVSAGTIKHYLREGLLPEPVRTSRNMAYYPPEFVDRIRTIKRLQEERFMPLRLIREVLEQADRPRTPADPTRAAGPPRGADTDGVLAEAGLTAAEIGALREAGAVA